MDEKLHTALVQYHRGLRRHAGKGYTYKEFLVPFGHHYGGWKLSYVRNNVWLKYTKTPELRSKVSSPEYPHIEILQLPPLLVPCILSGTF